MKTNLMKNISWAFILLSLTLTGCSLTGIRTINHEKVHHIVICWLKDPGNPKAREKLIEVSKDLSKIPGVLQVKAGPVLPSLRSIVDSSFDVAIIMTFPDQLTMHAYLKHPLHQTILRESVQPLTRKILIYDFLD